MTSTKVINAPTCLRADRPHRQMDGHAKQGLVFQITVL